MIRTRDLRKTYAMGGQTIHALDGVDLVIPEGQFVAVIGASGSGKSTLMNMLGGLDSPDSGLVEIDGRDIAQLNQSQLARFRNETLGFVFQSFQLLPRQTATANVALPLSYRRPRPSDPMNQAAEALRTVGLGDRLDNRPTELSGGQQQRVAIARALVSQPKLLLADEPTGALDSHTSKDIMTLLVELGQAGLTIVLITHDHEVADYAERVITMRDGQIIEDVLNKRHAA